MKMGILDDAIREHLELKRRRGADPSEIDRLEHEALGPVRRAHEAADLMGDESRAPAATYPFDEEASSTGYPSDEELPGWEDSPEEFEPYDRPSEPALSERPSPQAAPEPPEGAFDQASRSGYEFEPVPDQERRARHHEIAEEWEAHGRGELAAEPGGVEPDLPAPAPPPPASGEHPPAAAAGFEEETAEYLLEDDAGGAASEIAEPPEGEDVLEETPDFLQDTPDHDRLWFEQRPPRDFDFDG